MQAYLNFNKIFCRNEILAGGEKLKSGGGVQIWAWRGQLPPFCLIVNYTPAWQTVQNICNFLRFTIRALASWFLEAFSLSCLSHPTQPSNFCKEPHEYPQ